jgi:hypothetical protein
MSESVYWHAIFSSSGFATRVERGIGGLISKSFDSFSGDFNETLSVVGLIVNLCETILLSY